MPVKFLLLLKSSLLFNVFYCLCIFINKHVAYLKSAHILKKEKCYNELFQKKSKQGGVEDILFWKAPLEILGLSLYPKKFRRKKAFTLGNSVNLCDAPLKFQSQNRDPWKFPRKFHVLNPPLPILPPCLDVFWNSPMRNLRDTVFIWRRLYCKIFIFALVYL